MFRIDMDSFSMTSAFSGTSKTSREKQKTSRFSLRRFSINPFFRRQSSSARSVRSIRSNSEIETRSISSSQNSNNSEKEPSEDAASASLTGRSTPQHTIECPLCLSHHADAAFPPISTCHHRSCRDCLRQYLRIEIMESRVNIACPECAEKFHPNDIQRIVEDISLVRKYEEFMLRRILVSEPDARWCPAPDCGYAVIASGCASCPKLKCERPGCETFFCYHCKQYWHPNQTCDAARAERSSNLRSASISYSHESGSQKGDIKPCPRCGAFIIKMDDGSCNHMTCAVCGAEFCWLCMKEISDLHYLSPSGCTFWGKKPWSRKKKILWQLGTLVGAPVGIGLVAGIAVPAMVIGIPVWVGRKLHTKYEHASKHKRNLVITGGVSASILISPVLAGLAVGIGVPILLAYVYGVVPISLCRSGGCGVTTTNSGGVRFEFEEDNETTVGVSGPYTGGDAQSMETASHNPNPSIGPSIGEMSVAMTNSLSASGSHMERAGLMRDESDRDSASNRALIGNSLSGSLSGSAVAGPSGFQNRLEVHADVSANQAKRNSLSSESANLSLDAKSATVSWGDNASTKGLAGSICTRDKDNMSAVVPPLEVQVDVVSSSARYRHGSESSNQPNNMPGSPGSSRSAGGVVSEEGKTRRYWRQSRSVGERLHEHAERREQSERLSVHSFTPDAEEDVAEMGACGGVPDLRGPTPTALKGTTSRGSRHSVSFECVTSRAGSRSPGELPEVESDRPAMCTMVTRQHSDERPQTIAMKHSEKDPKKSGRKPFRKLSWKKTIHKNPLSP